MLIVNRVGSGVVRYFTDGRDPGRWSPAAGPLLGLSGPVEPRDLRRVLQGRDPGDGRYLPRVRRHRRRAGWDLVFGAPKSLSLLAATSGEAAGIGEAHGAAVAGVMGYLQDTLHLNRQGPGGGLTPADGLLSASFQHDRNAAAEPHLHTHVLVANLSCADGVWGSIRNEAWFSGRCGLAALYQLELRAQLQARGWDLAWRLRADGLADLAEVPRSAVRAASSQSRLAATAGRHAARAHAAPQPWAQRVTEAGFDPGAGGGGGAFDRPTAGQSRAGRPIAGGPAAGAGGLEDGDLDRKVSLRLAARRSDFRRWDVVVALACCHPGGSTVTQTMEWVDRFCRLALTVASPTAGRRWTTDAARRSDDDLVARLRAGTGARAVGWAESTAPAGVVEALTSDAAGIHFLGAPPGRTCLLAQAEVIEQGRQLWEQAGMRVAVWAPTALAAARWGVLTGIAPHRPGDRADVLVVDQADRRTSGELSRLLAGPATRLVFVEGGTLPRLTNPACHGLMEVADEVGRYRLAGHRVWTPEETPGDGRVASPEYGRSAAQALLAAWCREAEAPVLVGLGLEETRALNRAARALRANGAVERGTGPDTVEDLRPGDRLVVIKSRPGLPGYGTFGTVVEVADEDTSLGRDRRRPAPRAGGVVRVAWDQGRTTDLADRHALGGLGFGYAVTPHLASRTTGPLMVLGPAEHLGRARERVVLEVGVTRPGRAHERAMGL